MSPEHDFVIRTQDPGLSVKCSCGQELYRSANKVVPLEDVMNAVSAHVLPDVEDMVREIMKGISVKDIFRGLRELRKK